MPHAAEFFPAQDENKTVESQAAITISPRRLKALNDAVCREGGIALPSLGR